MGFLARRVLTALLTLLLVSLMTFAAFNIIPGDPARVIAGVNASEEQVEQIRERMGLNASLPSRYFSWLAGFVTGDAGKSLRFDTDVGELISERLSVTLWLALMSAALTSLIAFPAALLTTRRENSPVDRVTNTVSTISLSVPGFFLGVVLIWIFSLTLKLFTAGRYVPLSESVPGFFGYMFFPALAIAVPCSAMVLKFLRSSIFQQKNADYVRTAYSMGNTPARVLSRHIARNALIPAVTFMGMIAGDIFGGSIVTEQVFSVPGIGRLLITSVAARDFPLLQTLVVYIAFAVVAANTLVDIAIQLIDPRVRVK
ncbi:peptide ABC transporter [Clostridia bacterium]|nr:peptide ABC transporter [Clostridia bacterium]